LKRAQRVPDQPLSRLVEADTLGFPYHHLPERQQTGPRLRWSRPGQASQDGRQDPVPVGQVVLVDTPHVPPHGALKVQGTLLSVQACRLPGRARKPVRRWSSAPAPRARPSL